jgi:aldose sugar dehydrogenase
MGDRAGQVEAARGLRSVPDRVQSHTSIPGWKGDLLIAGLLAQGVVRLTLDGEKVTGEERIGLGDLIRNAVQGPNGAVYALTDKSGGEILRVSPDGPPS